MNSFQRDNNERWDNLRVRAVHELLLAERDQRVSSEGPHALHSAGGREGPARAALALVLDGGHGAGITPVLGGLSHTPLQVLAGHLEAALLGRLVAEQLAVLGVGEVGELVDAQLEGVVSGVVLGNQTLVVLEDGQTSGFLRGVGVRLAMGALERGRRAQTQRVNALFM